MSVRMHVAGARNITREAFLAAFADLPVQKAECTNGWHWITANGSVQTSMLDECLAKLPGPSLRVSAEKGCWYLRISKPGKQAFHSCVYSHYLASLADRHARGKHEAPIDADCEAWLDVTREFVVLQAGEITGALLRFEIPHDRETVASAIMGESVSRAELDSDLGNLPRFLVELGIDPKFADGIREGA